MSEKKPMIKVACSIPIFEGSCSQTGYLFIIYKNWKNSGQRIIKKLRAPCIGLHARMGLLLNPKGLDFLVSHRGDP
jgi:hypothetical protein